MAERRKRRQRGTHRRVVYLSLAIVIAALLIVVYFSYQSRQAKPIILYVDQGNGLVGPSNFGQMLAFASSHGFNTVLFQVYRQGVLLFSGSELSSFVGEAHTQGLKIFFALYITNSTQTIPSTIFGLGQDGVSLDMSALNISTQQSLLANAKNSCLCQVAVTATDMSSPLKPDLLVLETYGPALQQYIRHGIIASVGVFATTNQEDYQAQFQYALSNSDGVMVFDYAGMLKSGY
jgi:hypothetical protein